MLPRTRGDLAAGWIERYCLRNRKPIQLTLAEIVLLRRLYDEHETPQLDATLSAAVVLLHLCGREHDSDPPDHIVANVFTLLATAGPDLMGYLKRDGGALVCPGLGSGKLRVARRCS